MTTEYPVFVKGGDAQAEVERLIAELQRRAGPDADVGLHKLLYVLRADQTVVMVRDRATPLAEALRERAGWQEPREP